jgi:glucose 1-dehydrogenase
MKLAQKVAIVTGASRGIGYACAERLVREGARVMLVDVRQEGAAAAEALGDNARFVAPTSARNRTSTPCSPPP